MSKRFWSADWHLHSNSVIGYCRRPFRDYKHMDKRIIDNANSRVTKEDRGVLVGDIGVSKSGMRPMDTIAQLDGNWTLLRGNHDPNNKVKTVGSSMLARIGHFNVFVSHIPYFYEDWFPLELRVYIEKYCDFVICGHVHYAWTWWLDSKKLVLNVGCDQHRFMPISDDEVIGMYLQIKRAREHGKLKGHLCQPHSCALSGA